MHIILGNVSESLKASALRPSGVFLRSLENTILFFSRAGDTVRGSKLSLDYCKGRMYCASCTVPVVSALQLPWQFLGFATFTVMERD